MLTDSKILENKTLFDLPFKKDQIEYWGPLNHAFSDSFLTMCHTFLYQYFERLEGKLLKSIFSSFVEMVQNISEYNEKTFTNNFPHSYIKMRDVDGVIVINTANVILEKDFDSIKTIFEKNAQIPENELESEYKRLLLKSRSLGLLMLRKLKNSTFEYSFSEKSDGESWLSQELKINYGNT
jgi:hypothetical protein